MLWAFFTFTQWHHSCLAYSLYLFRIWPHWQVSSLWSLYCWIISHSLDMPYFGSTTHLLMNIWAASVSVDGETCYSEHVPIYIPLGTCFQFSWLSSFFIGILLKSLLSPVTGTQILNLGSAPERNKAVIWIEERAGIQCSPCMAPHITGMWGLHLRESHTASLE